MADEIVTVKVLVLDTASEDILAAAGNSVEVDTGNTGVITNVSPVDALFIVLYENGGGATVCTVAAGDRPPGIRADAALTVNVPSGDCVVIALEASKYIKSDDTIDIANVGQHVHMAAFRIPRGA